jgi:hypothetical protein
MIELKEGDGEADKDATNVGLWSHDDTFELKDDDVVRVWFTYRATKVTYTLSSNRLPLYGCI